jgi:phage gp46-like protein
LFTRKATAASLNDARRFAEDGLRWLVTDGVASRVEVETWWLEGRQGYLGILVTLHRPDDPTPLYIGPWEVYFGVD